MEVIGDFIVLIGKIFVWGVFLFILFLGLVGYGREFLIKIGIIEEERVEEKDSWDKPETEEERVLRKKNQREELERIEEEREKIEQERLVRKKELEEKRKKKEFWFGLDGYETEDELDKVFEKLGFETELTPPSNDEGIDHVLNGEIVVQTKNQKKNVGRPDLQKFWGSWKDSHKKGIFVSIHDFSENCKEFVKDKPIILYDVEDVIGMSEGKKPEWNE